MQFLKNKKIIYGVGALLLLLIFWFALESDSTDSIAIYTSPKRGTFNVTITTTGELRAKNSTSIRGPDGMRDFRIYQVNIQRLVPEGTVVKKGDFVAELDRSELSTKLKDEQLELKEDQTALETAKLDSSLALSKARNNIVDLQFSLKEADIAVEQSKYESPAQQRQVKNDFNQAKRTLTQAQKSFKTEKRKSESNIRRQQSDLTQQRREVERIQQTMKKLTIYAPEKGMVIYRRSRDGSKLTEGDQISVWDPVVAELPDFSVMNSITYVNEVDIQSVKIGQKVDIGLDAMPEKELSGRITSVANIGEQRPNSDSKVFEVTIEVNQSDSTLRPAMTTSNTIQVNRVDSAIYVPLETIHATDSLDYVFKKQGLNVIMQQVVLGFMNDKDVVIKEGMSLDDKLYLSTPSDTADVRKGYLPKEVLKKYKNTSNPDSVKKNNQQPSNSQRSRIGGKQEKGRKKNASP